jgi:hypothetical protein
MARTPFYPIVAFLFLLLTACNTTMHRSQNFSPSPTISESLFDYKDRTISEADIRQILDGEIVLQDSLRIAVFQYGGSQSRYGSWNWYDEDNLKTQQQLLDTFSRAIGQAARVQKVLFLPTMVTGLRPNIHQLRESAVRVQADMLLVYSLHSDLFRKYRTFKKDEAKAFATCELVLMDTRTGVIPHTNIVTKSARSVEERKDFTQEELQKRTLHLATLQTLLEAGNRVAEFLNTN